MKHLAIKNVGPIKDIDVNLLRFNFFIGPQSSGKSTIAKILSTCEWVEKEVSTTRNEKVIASGDDFRKLVEVFHKMEGFFDRGKALSYILYETDCVQIEYKNADIQISIKEQGIYNRKKICYIPAERNMVTLPELSGFEFGSNNLRSFLFDWYRAREFYSKDNKTDILGLGMQYYFDKDYLSKKDRIQHVNGETYDISLSNSSSGLQSVTPLLVMLQYYTNQYFTEYNQMNSFEQESKEREIRSILTRELVLNRYKPGFDETKSHEVIAEFNDKLRKGEDKIVKELYEEYDKACRRLLIPNRTTFIIEEPEQNLFPFTQVDLLEDIVKLCIGEREHGFTITTHSPFILNYLNVLIMRYYKEITGKVVLNPDDVAVFSTHNGRLMDLMQTNTKTSQKSVDTGDLVEAMTEMYEEYLKLKET